jgi:hypothetical protein
MIRLCELKSQRFCGVTLRWSILPLTRDDFNRIRIEPRPEMGMMGNVPMLCRLDDHPVNQDAD